MISPQDAFIFGVCVGFVAVFPVALVLHFVFVFINHKQQIEKDWTEYP